LPTLTRAFAHTLFARTGHAGTNLDKTRQALTAPPEQNSSQQTLSCLDCPNNPFPDIPHRAATKLNMPQLPYLTRPKHDDPRLTVPRLPYHPEPNLAHISRPFLTLPLLPYHTDTLLSLPQLNATSHNCLDSTVRSASYRNSTNTALTALPELSETEPSEARPDCQTFPNRTIQNKPHLSLPQLPHQNRTRHANPNLHFRNGPYPDCPSLTIPPFPTSTEQN